MKLNRLQRHTAYIIMLAEYERDKKEGKAYSQGFCSVFGLDLLGMAFEDNWQNSVRFLPELNAKKPKKLYMPHCNTWFTILASGREKRIELLKQCIIETA